MIYMALFWGKACIGISEGFVPARRDEIITKNLRDIKTEPRCLSTSPPTNLLCLSLILVTFDPEH